jgi:hypothetical protein
VTTLVAAAIGAAASGVSAFLGYWWKTRRDLNIAAARCYDRLLKLRNKPDDDEFNHLGVAGDLYVTSIGAALLSRTRRRHWEIYELLVPMIMRHDLSGLDHALGKIEELTRGRTRTD